MGKSFDNNKKCIDTYRDELLDTKINLYRLKNYINQLIYH